MRIALARLLLSPAGQAASSSGGGSSGEAGGGLLLLDEPTNHLDAAAVKWLASFLGESGEGGGGWWGGVTTKGGMCEDWGGVCVWVGGVGVGGERGRTVTSNNMRDSSSIFCLNCRGCRGSSVQGIPATAATQPLAVPW